MTLANKISAVITQEQETQVVQHIHDSRDLMPFLVALTSEERVRAPKMSRGKVDFLETAAVHIQAKPDYLPAYVSFEEFKKDMDLRNSLHRIRAELAALSQRIDDTILQVETEAYQASRLYYKSAKAAAKEGGEDAERISRDLAYHYKKRVSKEEEEEEEEEKKDKQE